MSEERGSNEVINERKESNKEDMEDHYEQLTKKGLYSGVFQSIKLEWLSGDGKSVLDHLRAGSMNMMPFITLILLF